MELTGLLQMAPFRGMKEEELVAFLFGLPNSLKHFEPGDIIARQGDLCKGLYILASGSVRAGMINDEGKELTVEEIGAPNLLASAFIFATENRFPVNVEAIGPCEVFVIGKERFLEFMRLHPLMMQNFLKKLTSRKFLAALAGVATGLAMVFGVDETTISTVAGAVTTVASVVSYIMSEGMVDAAAVGAGKDK